LANLLVVFVNALIGSTKYLAAMTIHSEKKHEQQHEQQHPVKDILILGGILQEHCTPLPLQHEWYPNEGILVVGGGAVHLSLQNL
jgi:hypothetical protein